MYRVKSILLVLTGFVLIGCANVGAPNGNQMDPNALKIAMTYKKRGDFEGLVRYQKAELAKHRQTHHIYSTQIYADLFIIGNALMELGRWKEALPYLSEQYAIARKRGNAKSRQTSYKYYGACKAKAEGRVVQRSDLIEPPSFESGNIILAIDKALDKLLIAQRDLIYEGKPSPEMIAAQKEYLAAMHVIQNRYKNRHR